MKIPSWLLLIPLSLCCSSLSAAPRWVAHASNPGPDSPPAGVSRFDQLFLAADGEYDLPYPFSALIDALESRFGNGEDSAVREVLVPRGRSLQRNAAAPDFFAFPRAIIALDGEPVAATGEAGRVVTARLFVAHQPKTGTLEVISYNDRAGRFEFQVVENYTAGGRPRARMARRAMCLSCHQNAGPIFARTPWSETNFNVDVAAGIVSSLPREYASLADVLTLDAGMIDVLVERANYLLAAQLVWREGCPSARCRAAMLRAILQLRLSGNLSFDWRQAQFREDYEAALTANWKRGWPSGLALASHRIPDADPFSADDRSAEQDPLFERPAYATWRGVDPVLSRGVIFRLADFFTLGDIRALDRRLIELDRDKPGPVRRLQAACRQESASDNSSLIICAGPGAEQLRLRIEIELAGGKAIAARVHGLRIPGDPNIWQPDTAMLETSASGITARLTRHSSGLSQRLSSGNRIAALRLNWEKPGSLQQVLAEVEIRQDFAPLDTALERMLANQGPNHDAGLGAEPLRREQIVPALRRELGLPALAWSQSPLPLQAAKSGSGGNPGGDLALLEPYCGRCHAEESVNPPGFLAGDRARQRIRQCAPRMLARLEAWREPPRYGRLPMPPPVALPSLGTGGRDWPQSDHYRALVGALEDLVSKEHAMTPAQVIRRPYASLPECAGAD